MMFGRYLILARAWRVVFVAIVVARVLAVAGEARADPAEAKRIFTTRCMACHTFGKGVKVGPDLKGVTERRTRAWLLGFVRSSQTVIGGGDPVATALFSQFNQQRMPDWTDLSEAQIGSILDWLAISGPDQQDADARSADTATIAEIDLGRALFFGRRAFVHGAIACASCHRVAGDGGGTLGPELSDVYSQYQDGAMTQFLRHPCVERVPESTIAVFLAPEESFAIKAYLRASALAAQSEPGTRSGTAMVASNGEVAGPGPGGAAMRRVSAAGIVRVAWAPGAAGSPPHSLRATLPAELLFLVLPYAALAILLGGLGLRHALARRRPETIQTAGQDAWRWWRGTRAWRIGLAATAAGHLLVLVVPRAIVAWNGVPLRLYLLEASGFAFGVVALVGVADRMRHHVSHSQESRSERLRDLADSALLSVTCVAIVSGLVIAVAYRWGSSWSVSTLVPYVTSLASGEPAPGLVQQLPFVVRLHVFSWFVVLALVPFTSLAMILVAAGDRALLFAARPLHAAGRVASRARARLSPARWLWPEEDAIELVPGATEDARKAS